MADDILTGLTPPDGMHWFGTDQLGRDVFSRIIVGSSDILMVAPVATALGVGLGTIVGMLIGYFGGVLDMVAGRLLDAFMSLPFVVLVTMAIVALGPANSTVIIVIGLAYTPLVARQFGPRRGSRKRVTTSRPHGCPAQAGSESSFSRSCRTSVKPS
jgi:peptide/nickel transport system permease protein